MPSKTQVKEKRLQIENYEDFIKEFKQESDRGAALIGAAFLETQLRELLRSFLIEDDSKVHDLLERQLQSFHARIEAAWCLGLIEKEVYDELHRVKGVRNCFAHSLHSISFDDTDDDTDDDTNITRLCKALWLPQKVFTVDGSAETPREKFSLSVVMLRALLEGCRLDAKKGGRRKKKGWSFGTLVDLSDDWKSFWDRPSTSRR